MFIILAFYNLMADKLSCVQTIESHADKVWTLAWHPTGTFIATASSDKLIKIWGQSDPTADFKLKSTLEVSRINI